MDAAEHLASLATKADQAEQELTANLYTDLASAQDDIQAGRRSGPMFATGTKGHFAFYQDVEGGYPERLAVTNHVGLIGQTVIDQIPLIKVDPNQHPMAQLRGTLDTATKMKDDAIRLWESLTNIVEASQKLSNKCHDLQVKTVVRTAGATHADSEDAKQSTNEELMAMADRIKLDNKQLDVEITAMAA